MSNVHVALAPGLTTRGDRPKDVTPSGTAHVEVSLCKVPSNRAVVTLRHFISAACQPGLSGKPGERVIVI